MTGGRVIYIDKRDINREYQRHMRQSQSKYLSYFNKNTYGNVRKCKNIIPSQKTGKLVQKK